MIHTQPYVKRYNDNGEVINPITKDNPYLTAPSKNRRKQRKWNNRKTAQVIVVGPYKYRKYNRIHLDKETGRTYTTSHLYPANIKTRNLK